MTFSEPVTKRQIGRLPGLTAFDPVYCCSGRAGAVAVHQRGDQPTIDEAGNRDVIGLGGKARHGFIAVPKGLDLVAVIILAAAAIAMREPLGVIVLNRFQNILPFMSRLVRLMLR